MRGKRVIVIDRCPRARIIPAHAGQTIGGTMKMDTIPDHPRTCGANIDCTNHDDLDSGSSPHMRGKPFQPIGIGLLRRIIPAHAGQTTRVRTWARPSTDHPRTCGANVGIVDDEPPVEGSSPHMRGKPTASARVRGTTRIIPAHAGQTSPSANGATGTTDHPRTCGANVHLHEDADVRHGSSPHMRGKHRLYEP